MRIIRWIKDNYAKNSLVYVLMKPVRFLYMFFKYYAVPDRVAIRRKFKSKLGYTPNLIEPKTFQEKLQWLKLHDRQPFYHQCADKFAVRQWLTRTLGTDKYLIPLYFVSDRWQEVRMENMPDAPFVIKCNHDNGSHTIISDKRRVSWDRLQKFYRRRLDAHERLWWGNREWSYRGIKPLVMVEKLLVDRNGELLEFKFHCFHGEVKFIQFSSVGQTPSRVYRYLTPDFTPLPKEYTVDNSLPLTERVTLPPEHLRAELLGTATKISKHFPYYIRVDFYAVDDNLYVGELTFYETAGFGVASPAGWEVELGGFIKLPTDSARV